MRGTAKKAYLLGAPGQALALTPSAEGLRVRVPATAPDAVSSVVVLEGAGTVDPLPPAPIAAEADGTFALGCDAADLVGKNLRVEGNTQLNLTGWNNAEAYAQWDVRIDRPGTYDVSALYAASAAQAGGEFTVTVGESRVAAKTESTGGNFKSLKLGRVRVEKAGAVRITVKPTKIAGPELMRLRALTLQPVATP
jgi:hypothetical protein